MKNISLYLSIVLFILVAILYVDKFAGSKESSAVKSGSTENTVGGNIAYVNLDSLLDKYDLYNDLMNSLMVKRQELEANLASKGKSLERKALELQEKYDKRLITPTRAQELQQQLVNEQQGLVAWKDEKALELAENEQNINKQVYDSIRIFLSEYNKANKYQLIISNSYGGTLLYANEGLNITDTVLNALNNSYKASKAK